MQTNKTHKKCEYEIKESEIAWNTQKSKNNKLTQGESFLRQELVQKEHNLTHKRYDLKIRIHEDKLKRLVSQESLFESALRGQIDSTEFS